jgi:hypothetical protein
MERAVGLHTKGFQFAMWVRMNRSIFLTSSAAFDLVDSGGVGGRDANAAGERTKLSPWGLAISELFAANLTTLSYA